MFLGGVIYHYGPRVRNWFGNKVWKSKRKYFRRWEHKFGFHEKVYETALGATPKNSSLSSESQFKLGKMMVELESKLEHGASRQLIVLALKKQKRMTDKMAVRFLRESGYQTTRKQVLCSCSLPELYTLFEGILEKIENDKTRE